VNKQARGEGNSNCRWAGILIVADEVFSRFVGWDELVLLKPRASPGTMSSSSQTTTTHALLAQLAEQLTLNQRVVGSSPTGGTPQSPPHQEVGFFIEQEERRDRDDRTSQRS
jgi:hypothetical protein